MTHNFLAIILMFLAASLPTSAQTLSLKQCIEYAKQNNGNIKIAAVDSKISSKKVAEQIGKGLPQIDATGDLKKNTDITTSMMPGELVGEPGTFVPIKMGMNYNATGTLELTQKIFDASFWVGLSAAKLSDTQSELNARATEEYTCYNVSLAYYRAFVVRKQLENLNIVLAVSKQSLESTELKYKNGMAKKIDIDKIRVSYNSTYSQVQQTEMNYKQSLNSLKYEMGMPIDSSLSLSDSLADIEPPEASTVLFKEAFPEHRVDFQLQKLNLDIQQADRANNYAAYLPSLSFYANYSYQAYRNTFDVFQSGKEWYQSSAIGLQLKIPIFSGGQRLSILNQSQLNVEKAEENIKLKEQAIRVELSNYEIQYKTALDNIRNEKDNLLLAESVYQNTQLEFKQGTSSSLDLVQAESSLRETQNNYYTKLLSLYTARLDKEKASGTLIDFVNNLQ
jgi:outer membrane protein TolC